jgi:8-oxo-dGTP diphosphatase
MPTTAPDRHTSSLPTITVVAAVLVNEAGQILLAQRPEGKAMAGLWEFPGGKLEAGETPEGALVRELHEELGIDANPTDLAPLTFASHSYETFHLLMPVFVCRRWRGIVMPKETQDIAWVDLHALDNYPMPAADAPLLPVLRSLL